MTAARRTAGGRIDAARGPGRRSLRQRLRTLLSAFDVELPDAVATDDLLDAAERALSPLTPTTAWLALAVLSGRYPDAAAVQRFVRRARLDGGAAALDDEVIAPSLRDDRQHWLPVELVSGQVLVDLNDTSATSFATGIQRVARESARRWHRDHAPILVGWHPRGPALRRLSAAETQRGLTGSADAVTRSTPADSPVVVPWRCTYVLPELRAEPHLTAALHGLLRYSGNHGAAISYDWVPITTAETVVDGMSAGFAAGLAALQFAARIAPISDGAAVEYTGWRTMLFGAGRSGPKIAAISLPTQPVDIDPGTIEAARARFTISGLPMVLVVGSHEPRKNHLAVLHAAELCWRAGAEFSLLFIGGNAWKSELFADRLAELQGANRPVHVVNAITDAELWAAYRLARFTVFPSLNEGFGLPAAESLACGTPVITSAFGSMREIAADGGAVLVDPRDDQAIARAMTSLLTDDDAYADLRAEAAARVPRTWDDYARETWDYLVDERRPAPRPPLAPRQIAANRR